MTETDADRDDDAALAGEYVLGLLEPSEKAAFESRLERDDALRSLVRDWETHFAGLADDIPDVAPPSRVKSSLEDRLFRADASAQRRLPLIALLSGLAATLALIMLVLFLPDWQETDRPLPTYTAELASEDGSLLVDATFVPEAGLLSITRRSGAPAQDRSFELWLIADSIPEPVSLGVLPETAEAEILLPEELLADAIGGTIAISDEPEGGSPTGQPTGDVLAAAQLSPS